MMWQWSRWAAILIALPSMAWPAGLTLGPRAELTYPGKAHEVHLAGAAVAIAQDGGVFLTWAVEEGQATNLYLVWVGAGEGPQDRPRLLFAASPDGQRFTEPKRLDSSTASIPDHVRLAVDAGG